MGRGVEGDAIFCFYTILLLHFHCGFFILLNSTYFFNSLVQVPVTFISRDRIPVCTEPEHGTIRATNSQGLKCRTTKTQLGPEPSLSGDKTPREGAAFSRRGIAYLS